MIVTTPIRPKPTSFSPLGSLTLIHYLRKNGFDDVEFYNIDGSRPDYAEVLAHIRERKPDVLGVSAVVSTAYEYCKRLSVDVKDMLPEALIVLGGNMGASANVLLHRTGVDLVVLGEGENSLVKLCRRAETTRRPKDFADIPGLAFLDEDGVLVNTGYETALPGDQLYEVDWNDLEGSSSIDLYFPKAHDPKTATDHLEDDPRFYEPHRIGKRIATLYTSKGCVSRCTFCHRWDKSIRFIPVPIVMQRLDEVIERFDVGMLHTADENFGTDRRWLAEFCAEIKKRDIIWYVGTRASGMTPEIVAMMKDAGCTAIVYGNETGSERMLEVMEKKVSIEQNYNAVKWTIEAGLGSTVQLVLGMPGESPETVNETIRFCKFTNTISTSQNPNDLSINYAQALPGTPLYEYARSKGLIGRDLDGEEDYLLAISDRDAHDEYTTLNFTDFPKLICETWRPQITVEVNYAYAEKFGIEAYRQAVMRDTEGFRAAESDTGYYANPRRLIENSASAMPSTEASDPYPSLWRLVASGQWGMALITYPVIAYRLRGLLLLLVLAKNVKGRGMNYTWMLVKEYLAFKLKPGTRSGNFSHAYKSLRKIVDRDIGVLPGDETAMVPLRKGR